MDNKRLVTMMLLMLGLMMVWLFVQMELRRRHPEWFPRPDQPAATQPVRAPAATATAPTQAVPEAVAGAAPTVPPPASAATAQPRIIGGEPVPGELGIHQFDPTGTSAYPMGLRIEPRGAALQSVTLNRFRREVRRDEPYVFQRPEIHGRPQQRYALATVALEVGGVSYDLSAVDWQRVESPAHPPASDPSAADAPPQTSATYAVRFYPPGSERPLIVRKHFEIRPAGHASAGYELLVAHTLENHTAADLNVRLVYNGPNVPPVESSRDYPLIVSGHDVERHVKKQEIYISGYKAGKPPTALPIDKGPLLWAGIGTAYFNAIVRPVDEGNGTIEDVKVQALAEMDPYTGQPHVNMTFRTPELKVPAGGSVGLPMEVYLGPRWRQTLKSDYYMAFPRAYHETLVLTAGMCGACTFPWLVNVLVAMLSFFHRGLHDWGLAIIALVLIVRLILHPITKRSQVEMSKMGKMGPEVERLKKKWGDNKEELNKAMMALYKEQGFTPVLGCLPMLLQMPIWIALWSALQSTFELRHASFLWGFTWIHDLAQPDRLLRFPPISLFFFYLDALNLLPILMGLVFWIQHRMTPKPVAATPQQEQQQKMMQWMTLLFPLLLYPGPSGLNLYILTSTAIGIWESKRVRDHIKAREEAEKSQREVVDAGPTRAARRRAKPEAAASRKGGLFAWFARLQERAEELRRDSDRKKGK